MSENDRLTISQCEAWLGDGTAETEDGRIVNSIVQQLLDTMRENERLKHELHVYRMTYNPMGLDIVSAFQLRKNGIGG